MGAEFPSKSNIANERVYRLRLLGTGAANPTIEAGSNVTVTWVSTGLYRLTWPTGPGRFIGWNAPGLGAATPGDLKGYSVVRDTYDATNHQLDISVYNASVTLADLAANQYVDLAIVFSESSS
jgi:hypothetical protein